METKYRTPAYERIANRLLRRFGYRLQCISRWNNLNTISRPSTLIDIGCAFDTPAFRRPFPEAKLLLFDPVKEYEPHMKRAIEERGGAYEITAVGSESGEIELTVNIRDPEKSSVFERSPLAAKPGRTERRRVPIATLDELVERHAPEGPFGLKIDTEGNELAVLRGARKTLERCDFVILEASVQTRFVGSYNLSEIFTEMTVQRFQIANVLAAEPDEQGLIRALDLIFVPVGKDAQSDATG